VPERASLVRLAIGARLRLGRPTVPDNTCIALYVPYGPGVSLKVTNFERCTNGTTIMFDCWKLYEVHFIDFREYHHKLIGIYLDTALALAVAHDIATELRF
jgi:hypothetical protein